MDGRKSIFELENKNDIQRECTKMYETLLDPRECVYRRRVKIGSYFKFINERVFYLWPYRDTCLTVYDFIDLIGIQKREAPVFTLLPTETQFLQFMELIYNLEQYAWKVLDEDSENLDDWQYSPKVYSAIHNIEVILSKMNCQIVEHDDKYVITKKNPDIDSIVRHIPAHVSDLLLSYGDFKIDDDLEAKKSILKSLDLHLEKDKTKLRGYDKGLYERIQSIVNKLGVNHQIKAPYDRLSKSELLEKYDECFTMMTHLLRYDAIKRIEEKNRKFFLENKPEKS